MGKPFPTDPDQWYIACPVCGNFARLLGWNVTENNDDTLTISPSILCYTVNFDTCAHYFVEHNQIKWC